MQTVTVPMKSLLVHGSHLFATCWRITRSDGTILRFTDHNCKLTIASGEEFTPVKSIMATARQRQQNLKNSNVEVRGVVTSDLISVADLRAGKYNEAQVDEMLVNWRFPWLGEYSTTVYWIVETTFDGEMWQAKLAGNTVWLRNPIGGIYTRNCRHRVGRGQCANGGEGVTLASITVSSVSVTDVVTTRKSLKASSLIGDGDGEYNLGELEWVTGANAGVMSECKRFRSSDGRVILQLDTPYEFQVGDTFHIRRGCDGRLSTCRDDFDNVRNHGGYPTIPGNNAQYETPNAG